jgi:hypothetical protein
LLVVVISFKENVKPKLVAITQHDASIQQSPNQHNHSYAWMGD